MRLDSLLGAVTRDTVIQIKNAVKYWAERFCMHHCQSAEFKIIDQLNYPQQTDYKSCGFFVIKAISLILNGHQYDRLHEEISQDNMPRVRRNLMEVLSTKKFPNFL